jgi:hypothetical protein
VVFYLVFDIFNIITVSIAKPTRHTYEADACVCVCAYVDFYAFFPALLMRW